jgi:ubiquinone/menaquinone biosynthesis C-methylase UbiE
VDVASWAVLVGACALAVAMLAAVGIAVTAFTQGRELSLWPPKIGQRPLDTDRRRDGTPLSTVPIAILPEPVRQSASGASGVVRTYRSHDISLPSRDQLFDKEFSVEHSLDFYQLIASHYDERNSGELITTHLETIRRIKMVRGDRSDFRVLDLGAGTGIHIAMAFFDDQDVAWSYVDYSSAMLDQFRQNFSNTALFQRVRTYSEDMLTVLPKLASQSYDVVLLSLVLSSMPVAPEFRHLTRLVAPGGALIISDIDPLYTLTHPFYAIPVDGNRYALRTRPVKPLDLMNQARAHGFQTDDLVSITDNNTDYSFLGVFRP